MVLASAVPHRRLQHPSVIIRVHQRRLRRRRWRRQRRRLFHAGNTAVRRRGRPRKRNRSSTATSSSTYNTSAACSARQRRRRRRVRRRGGVARRRRDPRQRQTRPWTDATAVGDARAELQCRVLRAPLRQSFARVALPGTPLATPLLRLFPRVRRRQAFLKHRFPHVLFFFFFF